MNGKKTRPPRVLVIYNPTAGRRRKRKLDAVLKRLRAAGCELLLRETRARGDAERLAREARREGPDIVAAAGGDGTASEAVNGLAGSRLPLAFIPLGTANVLALEIGLKTRPDAVARAIAAGKRRTIHVGRIVSKGKQRASRRFVMFAGMGYDAYIVENIDPALKRGTGKGAYVWQAVRGAMTEKWPRRRVVIDGKEFRAASVIVCNGKYYAGPFAVAPEGRLEDPFLHACVVPRLGFWWALRYGFGLLTSLISKDPSARVVRAKRILIEGEGAPIQGDGDLAARLPAEISVDPEPLDIIVP